MKCLLLFSLINSLGWAQPAEFDKQVASTLKAAELCVPKLENDKTIFCTGFVIAQTDLKKIVAEGIPTCKSEIQKMGFAVIGDNSAQNIPPDVWQAFINSTQRALSFHEQKVVAFKPGITLVDCLHEYVHVAQQMRGKGDLAPGQRQTLSEKIQAFLDKKILEVEKLEKSGKVDRAKAIAGSLQNTIQNLKKLGSLVDGLDEIEAHVYTYQNCDVLKCGADDRETIVANLFQRAQLLPTSLRVPVEKEANDIIREKKKVAVKKARETWKALPAKDQEKVRALLTLTWPELIKEIKKSGLRVVAIEASSEAIPLGKTMAQETFEKLESPTQEETVFLQDSKIVKGTAVGKYLCKPPASGQPALLLTKKATQGTAVHEYMHFLQSQVNANYCEAVFGQNAVDEEFKAGKMSRQEHDQKLLAMQALNALAEQEVYTFLTQNQVIIDKVEGLNNELMLKTYNKWLLE